MFCISCLPVYGLAFGSVILSLVGLLSLPISPIRNIWDKTPLHNGLVKGLIFAVLFIIGVSILPNNTVEDNNNTTELSMVESYEDDTTKSITTEMTTEATTETTTTEIITTEATTETTTTEVVTTDTTTEATTTEVATTEATTEATTTEVVTTEPTTTEVTTTETTYVLNMNTGKFHYPSCSSVDDMKESNKTYHTGSRDEVIGMGYSPCGRCNP